MTVHEAANTDDVHAEQGEASRPWASGAAAGAAVWGVAFLILRIFAVSGYSWETAFLVSTTLSLNDGLSILFGSLMAGHLLVAILLVFVEPILVAALVWGSPGRRIVALLSATIGLVILVTLTASFRSWWLPLGGALVFAAILLIRRLPEEHIVRQVLTAVVLRATAVSGVAVLVLAAFLQTPWVPHEVIETTNGTVTGHVLSVDSGYLNVLTDDHEFVILLSNDVLSRK
ncbi:MAG: hypothetical protein ABIS84_03640 [Arachnia sp.]